MATNFSPWKGSYVLNQFPSNVMFGMNGFHVSASGAIQGHHGPLVCYYQVAVLGYSTTLKITLVFVCAISQLPMETFQENFLEMFIHSQRCAYIFFLS